jgi:hypothetical protein
MSTEIKFGVECKNPQCGEHIVLGMYTIPLDTRGDLRNFVWTGPWKLTCPACGAAYFYNELDLRNYRGEVSV